MRIAIVIVLILVVLGAVGAYFAGPKLRAGWTPEAKPTTVRVEPAQRGELVEIVAAPGTVVPETKVSISARVSARIVELPFKEGDRVTKGDPAKGVPASVLVKLDATDIQASLRAAQARMDAQNAELETAQARLSARAAQLKAMNVQLENRQTELSRQEALLANNDVPKQTVDDLRAQVDQLKAEIEGEIGGLEADRRQLGVLRFQVVAAEAEIDSIRDRLSYTTIVSPIDGVVTKLNTEVGEIAVTGTMNNAGTVILEVADLDKMIVEARVDETDVAQLKKDQKAAVRVQAYPDVVFDGVVTAVALARTEPTSGQRQQGSSSSYYEAEVLLDRGGRDVIGGLTADVEIQTKKHDAVVRVPSQAVLARQTDSLPTAIRDSPQVDRDRSFATVVYRLVDGKAIVTPVKVGPSDVTRTAIEAGLDEGASVIVGPFSVLDKLQHDQAVTDEAATTKPATQVASH